MSKYKFKSIILILFLGLAAFYDMSFANEGPTPEEIEASQAAQRLIRVQREIELLQNNVSEQAKRDMQELAKNKEAFLAEYNKIKAQKLALENEYARLQTEFETQTLYLNNLKLESSAQEDSRNALKGAGKTNTNLLIQRLNFSPFGSLDFVDHEVLQSLAKDSQFPEFNQIESLLNMLMSEISQSGKLEVLQGQVYLPDGTKSDAHILYAGSLFSVARLASGESIYLRTSTQGDRLITVPNSLSKNEQELFNSFFNGDGKLISADLSRGIIFKDVKEEKGFVEHIMAGGTLIWPILFLGFLAALFALWRIIILYSVKFTDNETLEEVFKHVGQGQFDLAKDLLNQHNKSNKISIAFINYMLTHWNKSLVSLEKTYEEALLVYLNPLGKGTTFIAVAAAVAPLLGLLGTVTGMISTFDIITLYGNNDPKLLSGGISIALVTTELGLMVAIPLLLLHFFITRRYEVIENYLDIKGTMCIARASNFLEQNKLKMDNPDTGQG